jgi:hypothetical protein
MLHHRRNTSRLVFQKSLRLRPNASSCWINQATIATTTSTLKRGAARDRHDACYLSDRLQRRHVCIRFLPPESVAHRTAIPFGGHRQLQVPLVLHPSNF